MGTRAVRSTYLAVAAVAFLALGGIGFAYDGGGSCRDDARDHGHCPPAAAIAWVSPTSTHPSGPTVACSVAVTPSALTLTVVGLDPGSSCALAGTLENMGQQPVSLSANIAAAEPRACPLFSYADDLLGSHAPPTLNPGRGFAYTADIELSLTAGNACQGTHASFTVTITSGGSSSCEGFAEGLEIDSDGNGCCR